MALEAVPVGLHGGEIERVQNVGRLHGIAVFGAGTVAGFAGFLRPPPPPLFVKNRVRIILKRFKDVLVAYLTGVRARVR
jgi:hypothetical protein